MPSPTCAKTLVLLDLLAAHPAGLSSAEAARKSGLTGNLVFRILKTFVETGYAVQREDDKAYTLSRRLLGLSQPRVGDRSLVRCAYEALRNLRDATGETVQLLIETDGETLVLEQIQGTQALQVCGRVGMRIPLYSCAPGKAILAWWSESQRADWFRGRKLRRFTATTLSNRQELERELAEARQKGFTVDRAEGIAGIHCVASPVLDEHGAPLAAVTAMGPAGRIPEKVIDRLGKHCIHAASEIERQLRL